MTFTATITLGNILEIATIIIGIFGAVATFLIKQERMHGQNSVRFTSIEKDIKSIQVDQGEMKCDVRDIKKELHHEYRKG